MAYGGNFISNQLESVEGKTAREVEGKRKLIWEKIFKTKAVTRFDTTVYREVKPTVTK